MQGSPGAGRQVRAAGSRLSTRAAKCSKLMVPPLPATEQPLGGHELDRTHTSPVQPASCAWRSREHEGQEPGMRGWSQAPQRWVSRAPEPRLCRSGDEDFMVKYAERGTKDKVFLA